MKRLLCSCFWEVRLDCLKNQRLMAHILHASISWEHLMLIEATKYYSSSSQIPLGYLFTTLRNSVIYNLEVVPPKFTARTGQSTNVNTGFYLLLRCNTFSLDVRASVMASPHSSSRGRISQCISSTKAKSAGTRVWNHALGNDSVGVYGFLLPPLNLALMSSLNALKWRFVATNSIHYFVADVGYFPISAIQRLYY